MCGIAGSVGAAPPELLPAMLSVLEHRGPDDRGMHADGLVALGMTRLAIIDLATGRQPMTSEDGRCVIVFNGEIYNFRAIRGELEARGRRFKTRSDTEVILAAYEEFGDACVERLRGMFAFAIWDSRDRLLFLARDRVGKKPLCYHDGDARFLFASDVRALLADATIAQAIDWDAFHHYLAFGCTPGDRTMLAGIAKLPPGHTATLRDGRLTVRRYWTLPCGEPDPGMSLEEAAARVRAALRDAVRLRLESDVPLGVFLSGGIDSSAIVASVREVTQEPIRTFSVGFGRTARSFDELPYARLVAERFGTDHHEEILEPDVGDVVPAVVRAFDEPFADSSAVATLAIAKATARHVKVALSGIGGDETFVGYPRYLGVRFSERYARWPRPVHALVSSAVRRVRDRGTSRDWIERARRFTSGPAEPLPDRYIAWTRFFAEADLAALVPPDVRARWTVDVEASRRAAFASCDSDDALDGVLRIDLATYLPDDLLTMADRATMAHSLELRAPFCDHRLIAETLAIPTRLKLPGPRLKALLKHAFADVLPRPVLDRPKQGFMIPLGAWLRHELRPSMEDLLAPEQVRRRGLLVADAVQGLVREHLSGTRNHADRLWTLMILEAWTREHLDVRGAWRAV